jgi:hypothetical protein
MNSFLSLRVILESPPNFTDSESVGSYNPYVLRANGSYS